MNPFGAAAAVGVVVAYVKAELPAVLDLTRAAYAVDTSTLPPPRLVTAAELPEIPADSWPAVLVVPERLVSSRAQDVDSAGRTVYLNRYRLAVEAYVRSQGYEDTAAMNRRYAAAVLALLGRDPRCRVAGVWAPSAPRSDLDTVEQDYHPTVALSAGRTIASSRTVFELTMLECPAALGPAPALVATTHASVSVVGSGAPLPVHPAYTP